MLIMRKINWLTQYYKTINKILGSSRKTRFCVLGHMTLQTRSQGPLSTSRKYPGYGWSRVSVLDLADSRDVI